MTSDLRVRRVKVMMTSGRVLLTGAVGVVDCTVVVFVVRKES